jgi:hypothetical protein
MRGKAESYVAVLSSGVSGVVIADVEAVLYIERRKR